MKTHIWSNVKPFPGKVNFVDSNNVILGYGLEQDCCEHACWSISQSQDGSNPIYKGDNSDEKEIDLDGYCFDPSYYERCDNDGNEEYVAVFKLVKAGWGEIKPDLFLRLENHHNGYYSHGFTFRGDKVIDDSL